MGLRRLPPDLRAAVGNQRRVLAGFDRGGWSPALFEHMDAQRFDALTWRKGFAAEVHPDLFTDAAYQDETVRTHQWRVADTTVDLPVAGDDGVFTMRQVSLLVANNKTGRQEQGSEVQSCRFLRQGGQQSLGRLPCGERLGLGWWLLRCRGLVMAPGIRTRSMTRWRG